MGTQRSLRTEGGLSLREAGLRAHRERQRTIEEAESFNYEEAEAATEMLQQLMLLETEAKKAALQATVEAKLTAMIEALSPLDIGSVIYFTKVFREDGPVYHYSIVHTTQGWAFTGRRTAYYDIGMTISILIGYGIGVNQIEFLRTVLKPIHHEVIAASASEDDQPRLEEEQRKPLASKAQSSNDRDNWGRVS